MAQPEEKLSLAYVLRLVDQLSPEDQLQLRLELASRESGLNWSNVNLKNPAEREAFFKHEEAKAGQRIKSACERLEKLGIVDKDGNSLMSELPEDMKPDSECDVGG